MRTALILSFCVLLGSMLAACGGSPDITASCDDRNQRYQAATEHEKLKVPEDLDVPDKLKELPLPEAAPVAGGPVDTTCLELPPGVTPRDNRRAKQGEEE